MPTEEDRKPSFEDVLESQFGNTSDRIWFGHDTQSPELRRILANAIGELVRNAYRGWYVRMESLKDVDNNVDPMLQREPAGPLDGVDLREGIDMNTVEETTAQSTLVQHGPQFNTSGEQTSPEMRTFAPPTAANEDLDSAEQTGNPGNEDFGNTNADAPNLGNEDNPADTAETRADHTETNEPPIFGQTPANDDTEEKEEV